MEELTPKQELFCQTYVKTGNATESYKIAYPKSLNWKPESINENASRMKANSKVSARIEQLQNKVEEKHDLTKDKIINRLKEIIFAQEQLGVDKIDLAAMNKAIDTVNKMLGYNEPEKVEHSGNLNHSLTLDDFYK